MAIDNSGIELAEYLKDASLRASRSESEIQAFIEERPELITRPKAMLNHGVYDNVVFSQFKLGLGGSRVADFMYLTSSSVELIVVLIELELPIEMDKLFTRSNKTLVPAGPLNKGSAQVEEWMSLLNDPVNQLSVRARIEKLMGLSLRSFAVSFRYVLVIGADLGAASAYSTNVKQWFANRMSNTPLLEICSYGSLSRSYTRNFLARPNVVSESSEHLKLKHLHSKPLFLSRLDPSEADLGSHRQKLLDLGYEIERWESGEKLTLHGKYAGGFDRAKELGISPFQSIGDMYTL